MLKLSTKGRYGLRAMIELAREHNSGPLMMSTITHRQEISRKYLHALLTTLKSAGLVRAVRGAKGGFVLSRDPHQIKISEICEALEGKLAVVECVANRNICARVDECETWSMWKKMNDAIMDVLETTTLADLVKGRRVPEIVQPDLCTPQQRNRH